MATNCYNPLMIYQNHHSKTGPPSVPHPFHGSHPSAGYYPYNHSQYLSCVQDNSEQIASWHQNNHLLYQGATGPNWPQNGADCSPGGNCMPHGNPHLTSFALHGSPNTQGHFMDPQVPSSSPITVSGSDMSSPGAQPDSCSPVGARPAPERVPYDWMKSANNYQSQPNPGKTRTKDKYRVVYSDTQRLELEKEFHYSKYITIRRKSELASTLALSERQVKIWFQNRRAKDRKQIKKHIDKEKVNLDQVPNLQLQHSLHQLSLSSPAAVPGVMHALQHGINAHSIVTSMASPTPPHTHTQTSVHGSNLPPGIM